MSRHEIKGSPISIAYGNDQVVGVFLSVYDSRLEFSPTASNEVNAVTEVIGMKDGSGSYFNLHTGPFGFGQKVSYDTMRVYLSRFGVSDKQINSLFNFQKAHFNV